MSTPATSSRRAFLKAGAIAAAPLAAAPPAAALAGDARRLKDEAEIRALHAQWMRRMATGSEASDLFAEGRTTELPAEVRSVATDHAGEADRIEIAADGRGARGWFAAVVELETELPRDTTLGQMAHLQGGGRVRTTGRRVLKADYVKTGGAWAIARLELEGA